MSIRKNHFLLVVPDEPSAWPCCLNSHRSIFLPLPERALRDTPSSDFSLVSVKLKLSLWGGRPYVMGPCSPSSLLAAPQWSRQVPALWSLHFVLHWPPLSLLKVSAQMSPIREALPPRYSIPVTIRCCILFIALTTLHSMYWCCHPPTMSRLWEETPSDLVLLYPLCLESCLALGEHSIHSWWSVHFQLEMRGASSTQQRGHNGGRRADSREGTGFRENKF